MNLKAKSTRQKNRDLKYSSPLSFTCSSNWLAFVHRNSFCPRMKKLWHKKYPIRLFKLRGCVIMAPSLAKTIHSFSRVSRSNFFTDWSKPSRTKRCATSIPAFLTRAYLQKEETKRDIRKEGNEKFRNQHKKN
jgi:hypothetical protein